MKQIVMLIAILAALGNVARAQDVRSDAVACRDSVVTGLYRRCALWMDQGRVRRGEEGVVVAGPRLFGPPRLTTLVAGDTAMAYAEQYERRYRQSMTVMIIGLAAVAASSIAAECNGVFYESCPTGRNDALSIGLLAAGAGFMGVGIHLQVKAQRAGVKAIWWNNERFAR